MSTAFITHSDCLMHQMGEGHPERPERISRIQQQLIDEGLYDQLQHFQAPLAQISQIQLVHSQAYIDALKERLPADGLVYLDPDTAMNPYTWRAALRAAGAVILATDLVMKNQVDNAFCNIRPPGHHAEPNKAMGFCFFNNVAIAAAYAMQEYQLQRVAIVDFDVHHGNGTEAIFRDEPKVLYCSTFQSPFYPFAGSDTVSDHIINVPLPAGTTGAQFHQAVERHWLPAIKNFKPQLIFISAGFDAHRQEFLAELLLDDEDYIWVTQIMMALADQLCGGKIISVLEGGYHLEALARSVAGHVGVLCGRRR